MIEMWGVGTLIDRGILMVESLQYRAKQMTVHHKRAWHADQTIRTKGVDILFKWVALRTCTFLS